MSEFADSFAQADTTAFSVFGETCTIGGEDYDCVIHGLSATNEVVAGRPGRVSVVQGTVIMLASDWVAAGGSKGTQITVGGGTYRVTNEPDKGYDARTVELQLGPLN